MIDFRSRVTKLSVMRRIALTLGIVGLLAGCDAAETPEQEMDESSDGAAEEPSCMELYELYSNVCPDHLAPGDWDTQEANECFADVWPDAEMEPTHHQLAWQAASTCDRSGHPLCADKLQSCQDAS